MAMTEENLTRLRSRASKNEIQRASDKEENVPQALATVSAPSVPNSEYTTSLRNLNDDSVSGATSKTSPSRTEAVLGVARAPATLPRVTRRTMRDLVFIPDLTEEVDAVRAREERRGDGVNGSIAPALFGRDPVSLGMLRESQRGANEPHNKSPRCDPGG